MIIIIRNVNVHYFQFLLSIAAAVEYAFIDETGYPYASAVLNQSISGNILEKTELTVYLSRFNGLLLYSIDNQYNQLVIDLQESKPPCMKVEFRSEKYMIRVDDLCKCKYQYCLYEQLVFSFEITDTINIMCNFGSVNKHSFTEIRRIKADYPIPDFDRGTFAHLWFINLPYHTSRFGQTYPNPDYLTGCIKKVTYKGETIKLNRIGVNRTCESKCQPGTCNDGNCLEAFNSQIKCFCNDTLLNGEFCNASLSGFGSRKFTFYSKIIKLSWNFTDKSWREIFILNNEKSSIEVIVSNSGELQWRFTHPTMTFGVAINKNYIAGENYIIMMTFNGENVIVKYKHNNNAWKTWDILVSLRLDQVEFHDSTFGVCEAECPNCTGDAVYKFAEDEINWLPMKLEKILRGNAVESAPKKCKMKIPTNNSPKGPAKKSNSNYKKNPTQVLIYIFGGIIGIQIVIILSLLISRYKKLIKKKCCKFNLHNETKFERDTVLKCCEFNLHNETKFERDTVLINEIEPSNPLNSSQQYVTIKKC